MVNNSKDYSQIAVGARYEDMTVCKANVEYDFVSRKTSYALPKSEGGRMKRPEFPVNGSIEDLIEYAKESRKIDALEEQEYEKSKERGGQNEKDY